MTGKECDKKISHHSLKDQTIFCLSPFKYPFDDIYELGIKKTISSIFPSDIRGRKRLNETKFQSDRADETLQLGFIMCQRVCTKIQSSRFIIADISEPNPNVYYELGLSLALGISIVLIGNKPYQELDTFGLINKTNQSAFIQYSKIADLKKKNLFIKALKNPIKRTFNNEESNTPKILSFINPNHTVPGLLRDTIRETIKKLYRKRMSKDEKDKNKKITNKWEIETEMIETNSKLDHLEHSYNDFKIWIIDTTISKKLNPYFFFCMGLGHGLGKEVIPITLRTNNDRIPFDVRGLWHVFYESIKDLETQLGNILPTIDAQWNQEIEHRPYKQFWEHFLSKNELHIITCARDSEYGRKGGRTNIDKWDYITVSELTHFLAKNFPHVEVVIEQPSSKLSTEDIENETKRNKQNDNKEELLKNKNCIIVGSPDVSDFAEIVLAKLHDISPYDTNRKKEKGFIILKEEQKIKSSFYWLKGKDEFEGVAKVNQNGIAKYFKNQIEPGVVHGILTIAQNPFDHSGNTKILNLSGFTGISTYGIIKLLTEPKFKDQLIELEQDLPTEWNCVEIVVRTEYLLNEGTDKKKDNRSLSENSTAVKFEDSMTIHKEDLK